MAIIYLAGPMAGIEDDNYPAFFQAAQELRASGHTVINPAELFGGKRDLPRTVYIRNGIKKILEAELIATLSGWKNSRGAQLEVEVAREIGLPVIPYEQLVNKSMTGKSQLTFWD